VQQDSSASPAAPGPSALIGYTGFVGGNLARAARFDATYHSKTIAEIRGRSYDLVVCAALPAAKWIANRDPHADWRNIASLTEHLRTVEATEFVLISTVDVYPKPVGVDESSSISGAQEPYGAHRLAFERFVQSHFSAAVVRLPALFGPGLRKNVLYDLLTGHMLDAVNPESEFQWYDIGLLWEHLGLIRHGRLELVNLTTEPIATTAILERCFPEAVVGGSAGPRVAYDVRTRFAGAFGAPPPYILAREAVLDRVEAFVNAVRAGTVACA
jgi:hypothetical protein